MNKCLGLTGILALDLTGRRGGAETWVGKLQLDGNNILLALHVRGFPIPGWLNSRMRNPRIRRADCTPSFCIRDWNIRRFGVHGGSWNQSSVDTEGQLFEGARVISGGGNHLKQRPRFGNAGWRRPSRRLEVLWLQWEDRKSPGHDSRCC